MAEVRIDVRADTKSAHGNLKRFANESVSAFQHINSGGTAAFQRLGHGAQGLFAKLTSLKGLLISIGGIYVFKKIAGSILDAASATENYTVRLQYLLGSQAEGARLFKELAEYASHVPFEYREIMSAGTQLAGVMQGGVDEIKQWMPLIGDLAAVSGLSIEETTAQVVRMYSAGAASADLFRERGILAMLGFQAGVSYSAEETRAKIIEEWQKADSKFRGSTEGLAKNWEGLMSMMADHWFSFRNMIAEAGVFDFAKEGLKGILDWINRMKEEGKLDEWAARVSRGVVESFSAVASFATDLPLAWNAAMVGIKTMSAGVLAAVQSITIPLQRYYELWEGIPLVGDMWKEEAEGLRGLNEKIEEMGGNLLASADGSKAAGYAWGEWRMKALNAIDEVERRAREASGNIGEKETGPGDDYLAIVRKKLEESAAGATFKQIETVDKAFDLLKVKSSGQLVEMADKAVAAFIRIKESGTATPGDIYRAYLAASDGIKDILDGLKGGAEVAEPEGGLRFAEDLEAAGEKGYTAIKEFQDKRAAEWDAYWNSKQFSTGPAADISAVEERLRSLKDAFEGVKTGQTFSPVVKVEGVEAAIGKVKALDAQLKALTAAPTVIDIKGKGSAVLPISEKIADIKTMFGSLEDMSPRVTADFSAVSAGVNDSMGAIGAMLALRKEIARLETNREAVGRSPFFAPGWGASLSREIEANQKALGQYEKIFNQSVVININGGSDPAATARAVRAEIKKLESRL